MDTRGNTRKHAAQPRKAAKRVTARKATRGSGGMGLLSRALAVLLVINMTVMFALPIGIFAEDITIIGGNVNAEYGEDSGEATDPSGDSSGTTGDQSDGGGIFQIFDFGTLSVDENAGNWSQLIAAINNVNDGGTIHLTGNIQRSGGAGEANDLPVINKNVTIDGGGFELDFRNSGSSDAINRAGFKLASRTVATNFTLRNIKILRTNATTYPLISANGSRVYNYQNSSTANWTISIADLTTTGSPTSSFISASDSVVSFAGTVSWKMPATSTWWNMNVKGVTFEEDSRVSLQAGDNVIVTYPASQTSSTYTYVELKRGAQVTLDNIYAGTSGATESTSHHSAIRMNYGENDRDLTDEVSNKARALLKLSGAGTTLTCTSIGNGYGRWGGVVVVAGGAGGGDVMNGGHVAVDISGGAKMSVISRGAMAAMVEQIPRATLKVTDPGSELNLDMYGTHSSDYQDLRAVLRFRFVGGQTFDVQNHAEVNIVRHGATGDGATGSGVPAAIRFGIGESNSFYVRSGGLVHIENQGNGTIKDASTGDGDNAAIEFDANYFTFDVSGENSAIELIATQGPAVDAGSNRYGKIILGHDAIFLATGRTASAPTTAESAIFKAGDGLQFTADSPLYYDFSNTRPGGGNIFNVSSYGTTPNPGRQSTFQSINSDTALWSNGRYAQYGWNYTPVTGDPYMQRSRISYILYGENYGFFYNSDDTTFRSELGAEGLKPYTRVNGNNANPVITSNVLTNADKIVRFTGTVAEGLPSNPARPIWTDEVFGRLQHTSGSDTQSDIHMESLNVDAAYAEEVLGTPLRGILRYDTGAFLIPGDTYKVTSAWRGPADVAGSPRNHDAQNLPPAVTVVDVTPPTPVTLTSHANGGSIWTDQRTIKGSYADMSSITYNSEQIDRVYPAVNGVEVAGATFTRDSDGPGTWTIELPTTMTWVNGDTLSIIAVDTTGNKNPVVDTKYRDTIFPAAPSLNVRTFPVQLSADDANIGLIKATEVKGNADPAGVAERLEDLINAKATPRPGMTSPYTNEVSVTTGEDFYAFINEVTNFDREAWIALYGENSKDYVIEYQLDDYSSYTATAIVTVWPWDEWNGVGANNFEISLNSAALLNAKATAARDLELIQRAQAKAYEGITTLYPYYTGTLSDANVVVVSSGIQNAKGTYPVVFAMKNVPARTITIYATVVDGNLPVLTVDSPVEIWIGDLAAKPADAILPSQFDPTNSDAYKVGVSALNMANGSNITSAVTHDGLAHPVNIEKKGLYTVTYSVENDENNTIQATRVYVVNDGSYKVVHGSNAYILHAQSFVVKKDDANTSNIVSNSRAEAWKIKQSAIGTGTESIGFEVSGNTGYTVGAAVGSYDLMLRVVEGGSGLPATAQTIKAVVTDLNELSDGEIATTAARYAIAANNVRIRPSDVAARVGMTPAVTQTLISDAEAQGWRLTNLAPDASVVVVRNDIPASAVQNVAYDVVFAIGDDINRSIYVTVKFTIMNDAPVITGQEHPLIIPQQSIDVAHILTADELKVGMTIVDAVDGDLKTATQVVVPGTNTPYTTINTYNVGVYQIEYKITDSDGAESTALRAVVIQDGRYIVNEGDNIIIGAQNFVATKLEVNGNIDQIRSFSYAEAFTINGASIPGIDLTVPNPPAGFGAQPNAGPYRFIWQATGHTVTKEITGYIVEATKVHKGYKNVHYAIAASDFTVNLEDAATILAADSFVAAADAQAFVLVDGLTAPTIFISDRGGFAAVQKPYDITFDVYVNNAPLQVAVNETRPVVSIVGTVSQGNEPLLSVSTPVEIAPNGNFDPMAGVVATDEEAKTSTNLTGDITGDVKYNVPSYTGDVSFNPVDPTTVGLYPMKYWVTDSDNNSKTAKRLVVVNDGSYTVGRTRVLFGSSFVTKLSDVTTDSSLINAQIVSRSGAVGYDEDGTSLGPNGVGVPSLGTPPYSRAVGEYRITLDHADGSNPNITKSIWGKVVDVDELSPGQPNRPGATTWVYGNHADLTISEATTIVAGGDNALLTRLSAGATITQPSGTLTLGSVKIDSVTSDNGATSFSDAVDTYRVTVTDTANQNSVVLRVRVGTGKTPVVTATPKPLSYPIATTAGNLSDAQIMSGVTATDEEAKTAQNPTGSIIERVITTILDVTAGAPGTVVTSIPANQAGVYQVTYSATDVDGNTDSDSRALIVNDGRYYVATEYILAARSFVVPLSDVSVSTPEAQIRALAGAGGWDFDGTPQPVEVGQLGGYQKVQGDHHPIIIISGHPEVSKGVEARVFIDGENIGNTNGVNGDRYALLATNFRINLTDANALAQQSAATIAARFIEKSAAGSFDRTGSNLLPGSAPTLVDNGGFVTSAPYTAPTTLTLRMAVADEPGTFVDVKLFISNATPPQLTVPPAKYVALNASLDDAFYRNGASATDSEDGNLTPFIEYDASAVNTAVKDVYPVTYWVVDKDYNRVEGVTSIAVDYIIGGDYAVSAYSFVKPAADVTGSPSEILQTSRANAVLARSNDPAEIPLIPKPATATVKVNTIPYGSAVRDYPLEIGVIPEAPHDGDPRVQITAKVVEQNGIATDNAAAASTHYAVVANKVVDIAPVDMNNYAGDNSVVYARLIAAAQADGYRFDAPHPVDPTDPTIGVSDLTDINAVVKTNGIVNPVAGGEYNVVFTPTGQTNVELTVKFRITMGQKPVITFTEDPLVIAQQTPGHDMTVTELRDKMSVEDAEDGNLLTRTTAIPVSGGAINTHSVGVYKVNYSVTDNENQTTTATRLIVINDGRYSVIDEDNDGKGDVIIGARNFVATSSQVRTGSEGEVRSFSGAEAWDNTTRTESVAHIATMPSGWGPNAAQADYKFTWYAEGHPAVTKEITGFIRNGGVVDPGDENGQYGLVAWHFQVNLDEAAAIYAGGNPALLIETRAEVIKLVDSAEDRAPRISDSGAWLPLNVDDRQGDYDIKISVVGQPDNTPTVTAIGTVSQGGIPRLEVPTPLTVWIGAQNDPERTPGSILPGDYNDLYGISAEDDEDGPLTDKVEVNRATSDTVDLTKVGLYHLNFSVTDSDNNTVPGERVVVVNDGRIIPGVGRLFVANGYVVQSETVAQAVGSTAIRNQIVALSGAEIFDAKTGESYGSALVTVANDGGYSATAKENPGYRITLNAPDVPSGTLVKNIEAVVVDATDIDDDPKPHDPMVDTTYIYGNDITLRPSQVQDLLDAADTNAAVIEALGAGASITTASGAMSNVNVRIDSISPALAIAKEIYTVKISDVNGVTSLELTIRVDEGDGPTITAPKPVVVAWSAASGNLTRSELLDGIWPKSNTPWSVTALDDEDGDITANIVITDPATGNFPQIPRNIVGVYQVRYRVVDADGNPDSLTRAVVIDDGNVVYDDEYVLIAASFLIGSSEVNSTNAQILDRSGATAAKTDGTTAQTWVPDPAGYSSDARDYKPIIGIVGYDMTKIITARVYNDGDDDGGGSGDNGNIYSLYAHNFRINIADANALKAQAGTPAYAQTFLSKSGAVSSLRNTSGLLAGGTPALATNGDGGFATRTFEQPTLPDGSVNPAYPTRVPITIWVDEEKTTTVTIDAIVSNGSYPTLVAPGPKDVALNASLNDAFYRDGASANDGEDGDITPYITYDASAVDTSVKDIYPVTYRVVDSEGNSAEGVAYVFVDYIVDKDYAASAYSFVKLKSEVTGTPAEILAASYAEGWLARSNDPAEQAQLPKAATPTVKVNDAPYKNEEGEYYIETGVIPVAPHEGDPRVRITAKVVEQTGITTDNDATASTHYAVVANKVVDIAPVNMNDYAGDNSVVYARLLTAADADGYRFDAPRKISEGIGVSDLTDINAVVKTNGIVNPVAGGNYDVVFTPTGQPNIELTVRFHVTNGDFPVITFTEDPLVIKQTTTSQNMTVAELRDKMSVTDTEDGDLKNSTTVTVVTGGAIDKHSIGVYKVNYSVTDSQSQTTTASRLVVIDDGRYTIEDEDGDGKNDIIIGARNFVRTSERVLTGSEGEVTGFSYAEAYDNRTGDQLVVHVVSYPDGWRANPDEGDYDFTLFAEGHPAVTKDITGFIRNGDVVDPGTKDSQYGLVAWHFQVNVLEARTISDGGDAALLTETHAAVIPLLDGLPVITPTISDRGGFLPQSQPNDPDGTNQQGKYNITIVATGQNVTVVPSVVAEATVSQGKRPVLTVPTPLTVWIGAQNDPERTPGSILPNQYNDLYGITAEDEEDHTITSLVEVDLATSDTVNLAKVGTYHLNFSVTDSDNNTVTGERTVVVNDGRYIVGEGRILLANGYVIRSSLVAAVEASETALNDQIIGRSDALVFDAKTNANLGSATVIVTNKGGYSSAPNSNTVPPRAYTITLNAPDYPSGTLVKNINARVVGATVIDDGPDPHDPTVDTTYIYGNNITLRPSEVQDILDAADVDAATIAALGAGADVTVASGAVNPVAVRIDSITPALDIARGEYVVEISDVNGVTSIELTITVGEGNFPTITAPKPVVVAWSATATNLTRAELLDGIWPKSNTPWSVVAEDIEDGVITGNIVITDPATGDFPEIPRNIVDTYRVRYSIVDADGNPASLTRAVVIDDGNVIYDTEYVLNAASFLIGSTEVRDAGDRNAQILNRSGAKATQTDGTPAVARVTDQAGYSDVPDEYHPIIGVNGYNMTKNITAKVYDDVNGGGDNGNVYSLYAQNFRINLADANALKAKVGTADYAADFVARAKVESYLRNTSMLNRGGTPALATGGDGGFATTTFEQPTLADGSVNPAYPTRVPITFWVDEERETAVTITAIVSNGSSPRLTVPSIKEISLNDSFTDTDYLLGVSAIDDEDGNISSAITFDRLVNPAVRGLYKVTYSVTDSEGNETIAIGFVAVDLVVIGDYAIDAFSFVELSKDVTGTDAEILAASYAKAQRIRSNDPDLMDQLPVEVPAIVMDNGNYSDAVGEYTIRLGVNVEPGYNFPDDPKALYTGKVINRHEIETDADASAKVHYAVAANNVTISLAEVSNYVGLGDIAQTYLKSAAAAVAYRLTSSIANNDVDVVANAITSSAAEGDVLDVTFGVRGVPSVAVTVKFTIDNDPAPEILINGPLIKSATATSYILYAEDLMEGVTARDQQAVNGSYINLTSSVVVAGPNGSRLPVIDTSKPGVYVVEYSVADSSGKTAVAGRTVVVNDGRYEFIDENNDNSVDIIIGAKNYVVKRGNLPATDPAKLTQAKELSWLEVYSWQGEDLAGQARLIDDTDVLVDLPLDYRNAVLGQYRLIWTIPGHLLVKKAIVAEILADDYSIYPAPDSDGLIDKTTPYVIVAHDFSVNSTIAANINSDEHYINRADARIIRVVSAAPAKSTLVLNNGGFSTTPGTYQVSFADDRVAPVFQITINARVTNGTPPLVVYPQPIVVPIRPDGSANIDEDMLINIAGIVATDPESGVLTDYVQIIDARTGQEISLASDLPDVIQVIIRVVDGDDNLVEKKVAVVIDDGHFVISGDYILRAEDFVINIDEVQESNPVAQISTESGLQAWRTDGERETATVIETGGYRKDTQGNTSYDYTPTVGVGGIRIPIKATVIDTHPRYRVEFNANGGTLLGPSAINIIDSNTLMYMPVSPIRSGYTFRQWVTVDGVQFTASTTLTSPVTTVYATWDEIPVTPPATPTPPPTVIVNNPPAAGGSTTYVTVEPGNTSESTTLPEGETPESDGPTTITEPNTALDDGRTAASWSLFNLLATIFSLIMLVVFFIKFFFDRPRDEEYEEEPIDAQLWEAMTPDQRAQYQARREADYQVWMADREKKANRQKVLVVNAPVLLIVGIAMVEALVVLLNTQTFGPNMKAVDDWSVLFALILFVQLLTPMVAAIIRNNRKDRLDRQEATNQPVATDGGVTL